VYQPGVGPTSTGLSAEATHAVVAHGHFPQQVSHLRGCSLDPSGHWKEQWHREASGFYTGPILLFRNDTRFVIRRSERTRAARPRTRTHLVVGDVAGGVEVATSRPLTGEVTTLSTLGTTRVVALDVGPWGERKTTQRMFADGNLAADPVEVRLRQRVAALAADPLGRFLLSAHGPKVTVWDSVTWKPARTFDWKVGRVTCLSVSPDGTVAAAGGDKGAVAVWDVE
jgi:WD40 repeat protein